MKTLSKEDQFLNQLEGWGMFWAIGTEPDEWRIEYFADEHIFKDDSEAMKFVYFKATIDKSKRHQRVLDFIKENSPREYKQVLKSLTL